MRFIFLCLFGLTYSFCQAQSGSNDFKLPEILPPSPDVMALVKGGELSASPHTGAPNASIPIYSLKLRGYNLPISINYSSNGYKPEEVPSRTGLGWSLNAGGSVSRMVKGKPDDFCTPPSTYLDESSVLNYGSTSYYFIADLEDQNSYHDSQPDEYSYNVNGLSGKFIIQRDGSVLQLPYNNVKITVAKSMGAVTDIYITDGSGTKYSFGQGVIEQTLEHNLENNFLQKQYITTAWMLTNITIPTGEYITFSYGSISHYVKSGVMESVRKGLAGGQCLTTQVSCDVNPVYSARTTLIRYTSRYVTAINLSNGPAIAFSYEDRPDAGGDNRLDQILVSNGFGTTVKKVEMEYLDRHQSTNTPFNEGFFLKKVHIKDPTATTSEEQVFELSYVDEANAGAGATITNSIDHLGFANGASNSTLLPANTSQAALFASYGTANREPNGVYSEKGMLQRIKYPTDGYDEFYYQPNMKTWWDSADVHHIISATSKGYGDVSPFKFYNTYFTPSKTQVVEFHLSTFWYGSPPVPDGDPAPKIAYARLYNNSTNALIAMRWAEGFPGGAHYVISGSASTSVDAGVEYRLEIEVRYSTQAWARADIVYDAGSGKEWKEFNEELCGVRVRKILSYDPVSRKSFSKFYRYRSLTDTTTASALKYYYPLYVTANNKEIPCGNSNEELFCYGYLLSSNSASTLYGNSAAGVVYKWVIESDDSLFANGGIEHTYKTQGEFIGYPLIGGTMPEQPVNPYNFMNGVELEQMYFNRERQTVKKVEHTYSSDNRINTSQYYNYIVRKRYDKLNVGPAWDENDYLHYDVTSYSIFTRWEHLDMTTVKEYDLVNNKILETKIEYTYGNTNNIQPTKTTNYASDGTQSISEMKYPTDLTGQAVCSTMVTRNIVDPVMEEKSFKNTKFLYQQNTDYKDWFNNATILTPELIKNQKNGSSQETRIRFYQYDVKGNPLELSKENDIRITYIWDYLQSLPIAEVSNASWGSGVAFTSFEADGKGGWTFSGTPVTEGTEPAGKKSYSISTGNITYSGSMSSGQKYIVSYWSKGGTALMNGAGGTSMISKNGWTLYRHLFTYGGSGGVTISGSGYVDELRLYPETAFMKTYTYTPEVGITSVSDVNSIYQRYEYDAFNRLLRIRDMDNNILKQYEYKYGNNVTGCTNTTPDWQVTGNYRCAKNNPVNNNNTGNKEQEEVDMNNCSETYGENRWVSIGSSSECQTVSNCTGINKRVVNGVCEEGCKNLIKSVYLGNLVWECTFRYSWSDGFWGPNVTETGTYYCIGTICGL